MVNPIKEAFAKVKEDIISLQIELTEISKQISELKRTILQTDRQTNQQTEQTNIPTQPQLIQTSTNLASPKEAPEAVKSQNSSISIGNDGVPTDRQTNQQTDRQTTKFAQNDPLTRIERVSELINSLDELKRDLRKQFKQLTPQEMLVFSTIYQLEDQRLDVDYSLIAQKTSLSESSIRDYVLKIIKKGVPLVKNKENNKKVTLSIPQDLRRIASLDTILTLRNI